MRSEISVNVPSASTPLTPADPTTINTHSPPPQNFSEFFPDDSNIHVSIIHLADCQFIESLM